MTKKFRYLAALSLMAMCAVSCNNASQPCVAEVQEPLEPGEWAPAASPGQNNFGGTRRRTSGSSSTQQQAPRPAQTTPEVKTVPLAELSMSDPFILADEATHTYYLTSSGGRIYTSPDLKMWTGPYQAFDVSGTWMEKSGSVAAAELHKFGDKYYYIGTFRDPDKLVDVIPRRYNVNRAQSMILVADKAIGPYKPIVNEYDFCVYPENWAILDGTMYQENGKNYVIFVHEWLQTIDGTMELMEMSEDWSRPVSKPKTLFRASEAPWVYEMNGNGEATYGMKIPGWVTDGPELFRTGTGRLGMLWASWGKNRYCEGVAWSESGTIEGPWIQETESLKGDNSGHAMMFTTFEGKRLLSIHHVEGNGPRKPELWEIDDSGDRLVLGKKYLP